MSGLSWFYTRLYEMVDDPSLDSIISWSKTNKSFIIWNKTELIRSKLIGRLCCCTFSRFRIELENSGFVRIKGSEKLEFGHDKYFVRGEPELLKKMQVAAVMKRMKNRSKAIKAEKKVEKSMQQLQI